MCLAVPVLAGATSPVSSLNSVLDKFSWAWAPCPMYLGVGGLSAHPASGLRLWGRGQHQRDPGVQGVGVHYCVCVGKGDCASSWRVAAAGEACTYRCQ